MRWASSRLAEPLNTFISGWSANIGGRKITRGVGLFATLCVQFDKKRKAIVSKLGAQIGSVWLLPVRHGQTTSCSPAAPAVAVNAASQTRLQRTRLSETERPS